MTNSAVLLLNATHEPMALLSMHRVIVLLLQGKVEPVEADVARKIRSSNPTWSMDYPLVVRRVTYVHVPWAKAAFSRKAVKLRDKMCMYCGRTSSRKHPLTVDHILPLSRGGKNEWLNVVSACHQCNNRKSNKTPAEAGMRLRSQPYVPSWMAIVWAERLSDLHETQRQYIAPYMPKR